ncbi:MAG: aspartate aminotransferase family protein [Betaproteobacteria bacterium AqS2]|uniref:Aspartate aminotransferase family protein n=1 Tax=Candidatus Amphirhobacter heronislandensis TaxID=1732024 RepID=A0A930UBF3_9GAMM|nr:aspartate aminotransferase family protein [Betaproteobacteria bacterium AqS2]
MDEAEYRKWAAAAAEWTAAYRAGLREMPVRAQIEPGSVLAQLPAAAPEQGEDFAQIFADFERLVPPALTHWQHPRFFAYFPANATMPSVIAEQLTAAIAANCMLWQTSPAGTEMEIRMLEWLSGLCGLPASWQGVIQDSASSGTLAAVLTARERATGWQGNEAGLAGGPPLRMYYSRHAHASVPKAIMLAGLGRANAVAIDLDADGAMDAGALERAIEADRAAGMKPAGVVATVGATSTGDADGLAATGAVVRRHGLYGHVDAAWAGSAALCPEHRGLLDGLEQWDSYLFNPHKWLGTNFDLCAHYLKDPAAQIRTFGAQPDYLQTAGVEQPADFSSWTAPLGRRFRALKLWFVLRSYGAEGLRTMIRNHVAWAEEAERALAAQPGFAICAPRRLSLFLFRHEPAGLGDAALDEHNARLLEAINDDGFLYLTQTRLAGRYALRLQVGAAAATRDDVLASVERIAEIAASLPASKQVREADA